MESPCQAGHNVAKKNARLGEVCVWDAVNQYDGELLLGRLPTVEIWGIGVRLAKRLLGRGDSDHVGPARR